MGLADKAQTKKQIKKKIMQEKMTSVFLLLVLRWPDLRAKPFPFDM